MAIEIARLQPGEFECVEGTLVYLAEPREVQTKRGVQTVQDAKIEDPTGVVDLTLWGDQVARFKAGDKVAVHKGWTAGYMGKIRISSGKLGMISLVATQ